MAKGMVWLPKALPQPVVAAPVPAEQAMLQVEAPAAQAAQAAEQARLAVEAPAAQAAQAAEQTRLAVEAPAVTSSASGASSVVIGTQRVEMTGPQYSLYTHLSSADKDRYHQRFLDAQAADAVAVDAVAVNDGEEQGGSGAPELEQVDCSGQDEQGVGEGGLVEGSDEEVVESGDDGDEEEELQLDASDDKEEEEQSGSEQEEQARRATGEKRSAPTSPRHSGRPTQRPKFHGE